MSNSTFSGPIRAGKKPFLAGSTPLTLVIQADATGVVGQLPAGATLTGVSSNEASLEVTIGSAYATNVTPGVNTAIDNDVLANNTDVNITTSGTADAVIRISYILMDSKYGANG